VEAKLENEERMPFTVVVDDDDVRGTEGKKRKGETGKARRGGKILRSSENGKLSKEGLSFCFIPCAAAAFFRYSC
jgi:hypothetical protein